MLNSRIDKIYLATGTTDLRKSIDGLAIRKSTTKRCNHIQDKC